MIDEVIREAFSSHIKALTYLELKNLQEEYTEKCRVINVKFEQDKEQVVAKVTSDLEEYRQQFSSYPKIGQAVALIVSIRQNTYCLN